MKQTFEQYLMSLCIKETHCLDDESPDVYEKWIAEKDIEDIIELAQKWEEESIK